LNFKEAFLFNFSAAFFSFKHFYNYKGVWKCNSTNKCKKSGYKKTTFIEIEKIQK
jgi:hypothetical protein